MHVVSSEHSPAPSHWALTCPTADRKDRNNKGSAGMMMTTVCRVAASCWLTRSSTAQGLQKLCTAPQLWRPPLLAYRHGFGAPLCWPLLQPAVASLCAVPSPRS
jgi:hypothetical protein